MKLNKLEVSSLKLVVWETNFGIEQVPFDEDQPLNGLKKSPFQFEIFLEQLCTSRYRMYRPYMFLVEFHRFRTIGREDSPEEFYQVKLVNRITNKNLVIWEDGIGMKTYKKSQFTNLVKHNILQHLAFSYHQNKINAQDFMNRILGLYGNPSDSDSLRNMADNITRLISEHAEFPYEDGSPVFPVSMRYQFLGKALVSWANGENYDLQKKDVKRVRDMRSYYNQVKDIQKEIEKQQQIEARRQLALVARPRRRLLAY